MSTERRSDPMVLMSNLLGLAGLIAAAVAVGGLTGNWWWSLLTGGVAVTALAMMAQRNASAVDDTEVESAELPRLTDRSRSA